MTATTAKLQAIRTVREQAERDGRTIEVFDDMEPDSRELLRELMRLKEELEGLTGLLDARGHGVSHELFGGRKHVAREPVVEERRAAPGEAAKQPDGGAEGFQREVRYHAEPRGDGWDGEVKTGGSEFGLQRLLLKVDRNVRHGGRDVDLRGGEHFALPLLRGRVVDLEDANVRVRIAISEGVEPRAEDEVLADAIVRMRCGERVFRDARAGHHEGAEGGGEGALFLVRGASEFLRVLGAEDADSERIVEDEGMLVVELVRSTAEGYAECRAGWLGFGHASF